MKREILIFIAIFVFLTLVVHLDEFISYPLEHIKNLSNSGAYGLGFMHPLFFSLGVYVVILIPRFLVKLIKKLLKKA